MVKIKQIINCEKEQFKANKCKYLLEKFMFFVLFLLFFSLASFSYSSLHLLPIGIMGVLAVLIIVYKLLYDKLFFDKTMLSMILFLLCVIISCCINGFFGFNNSFFLLPLMFFFLYNLFKTNENFLKKSLVLFFVAQIFFAIYYIYFYRTEIFSLNFSRIGSDFGDENVIGSYFSMAYVIGLYYLLFKKQFLILPILAMFLFLGVTTGSKAFLLLAIIPTIIQIIMFFGKKRWYLTICVFAFCIIAFIILSKMKFMSYLMIRLGDLFNMLKNGGNQFSDFSTFSRLYFVIEGVFLFLKNPLVGLGANAFYENGLISAYTHNTIAESLCDFGLLATLILIYPVVKSIKTKKNSIPSALYYSLLSLILIGAITLVQFSDKFCYIQLALLCSFNISSESDILLEVKLEK